MNTVYIYVDGSYRQGATEVTGAAIYLINENPVTCIRYKTEDTSLLKHRQVSGEVVPTLCALEEFVRLTKQNNYPIDSIVICYDYTGIKDWLDGTWKKANNDMSRDYMMRGKEAIRLLNSKGVKVQFNKIKSHTGVKYNEYADSIANGYIPEELIDTYQGEQVYYLNERHSITVV